MKKLLPQANSLETLVKVFIYRINKLDCTVNDVAEYCGFEPRQASYYLSACYYIDILDENQNVTDLGKAIIDNKNITIKEGIYERIISDKIIGPIFAKMLIGDYKNLKYFAKEIISTEFHHYSAAVIERRISTIFSWCYEIKDYITKKLLS